MSAANIIQALSHLLRVQASLQEVTAEKTVCLKNGDVDKLNTLLKEEERHIKLLEEAEQSREIAVQQFLANQGLISENVALADLYKFVDKKEREQLQNLQTKLLDIMMTLKEQNELNRELTRQSLQFINLSLDMLQPEANVATYQHPEEKQDNRQQQSRSIFDTKA